MNFARYVASKLHSRLFSSISNSPQNILSLLKERTLIKLTGNDSAQFLQGLITNDINHLQRGLGCMYTLFLNTKGRVLYDAIIYKIKEDGEGFFVECDVNGVERLIKHLKIYRVRRKVDIESVLQDYSVYALFNGVSGCGETNGAQKGKLEGLIVPCSELEGSAPTKSGNSVTVFKDLFIFQDPRISLLGSRIIAPKTCDVACLIPEITPIATTDTNNKLYKKHLYNLGVGEGITDLPPDNCFPLESNCDYLHGISFHKGCYIGQELTARTHHTGVVRKRLMPIYFKNQPNVLPEDGKIVHEGKTLGKLRSVEGDVGLGLLRVSQVLALGEFGVGDGIGRSVRPNWWPLEASKERVTAN